MPDNQPMPFLVNIPGVIKTQTQASSNAQAISYALSQAFTTRNSFWFEGKKYEGEVGLKALIADVLNSPGMFDYCQQLPGMPSAPVEVSLPMAPSQPAEPPQTQPQPGQPGQGAPAMASKDEALDSIIRLAAEAGVTESEVQGIVSEAARVVDMAQEDMDDLAEALYRVARGGKDGESEAIGLDAKATLETVASRYKWKRAAVKAQFHKRTPSTTRALASEGGPTGGWLRRTAKYTGDLDADMPAIALEIIADSVAGQDRELSDWLANHARIIYRNNQVWGASLAAKDRGQSDAARDSLYAFMEHWVAARKKDPSWHADLGEKQSEGSPASDPGFDTWLDTFIEEKGIDLEQSFDFDLGGEWNHMPYGAVVEAIHAAPAHEQAAIKDTLVKIDFANADVLDYLRFLGRAMAKVRSEGLESEGSGAESRLERAGLAWTTSGSGDAYIVYRAGQDPQASMISSSTVSLEDAVEKALAGRNAQGGSASVCECGHLFREHGDTGQCDFCDESKCPYYRERMEAKGTSGDAAEEEAAHAAWSKMTYEQREKWLILIGRSDSATELSTRAWSQLGPGLRQSLSFAFSEGAVQNIAEPAEENTLHDPQDPYPRPLFPEDEKEADLAKFGPSDREMQVCLCGCQYRDHEDLGGPCVSHAECQAFQKKDTQPVPLFSEEKIREEDGPKLEPHEWA